MNTGMTNALWGKMQNMTKIMTLGAFKGNDESKSVASEEGVEEGEQAKPQKLSDKEVLEKLSSDFYEEHENSLGWTMEWIVKNLPSEFDEKVLEKELGEKEKALDVINSQLSKKVMSNYNAFVEGMTEIHDLGVDLQTSTVVCKNGRRSLNAAKEEMTQRVLYILAEYRRRQTYKQVLENLNEIKGILAIEKQLKDSLEEGNFPKAIELCLECRNSVNSNKHFTSVQELGVSLQESYNVVQDKLDASLLDICRSFNTINYERILVGYRLLGLHDRVLEKMKNYFLEIINSNTKNVLTSHAMMGEQNLSKIERIKKMKFRELCASLKEDKFLQCLVTILELLSDVMYCHYQMIQWHTQMKTQLPPDHENIKYFEEVREGLEKFRKTIWDDMQRKVSVMLAASTVATFKIDEFLKVFDSVFKFIDVGEEFSDSDAHNLRNSMKLQSKAYFENLHKAKIEDLCTMLENEMWQKCPVQRNFTPNDVKEFKHAQLLSTTSNRKQKGAIFASFKAFGNPFSRAYKQESTEDEEKDLSDDEELVSDELNVQEVEEVPGEGGESSSNSALPRKVDGPLMTTTTINVIRFFGKYLHTMKVLQPIAYEVFVGITQLFEYYLLVVYTFFSEKNEDDEVPITPSPRLQSSLVRFKKQFTSIESPGEKAPVKVPQLSSRVSITSDKNLFGIANRTVAIESLHFLEEALNTIKKHLQQLLPKSRDKSLSDFYFQSVEIVPEMTQFMYKSFVLKLINWDEFLQMVSNTKWDIKEVGIEYSPYVDNILKQIQTFSRRLAREAKGGSIPDKVVDILWVEVMSYAMEQLVEGYSRAKKCSNSGRVLMSLDLQNFTNNLQKLTPIRPIPKVVYVDTYIKAYFLPEAQLLSWCKEHMEYSLKQWQNIIAVGVGNDMKKTSRQQLLNALEELDKARKAKV